MAFSSCVLAALVSSSLTSFDCFSCSQKVYNASCYEVLNTSQKVFDVHQLRSPELYTQRKFRVVHQEVKLKLWGQNHGAITIMINVEEMLLPNSRWPSHGC
jgi:hypothetical protein